MNNQIAIPELVGQLRTHSFSPDNRYGQFETITGVRLWELSLIDIDSRWGGPSDDELRGIEQASPED